jgi:hypothetical protein
MDVKLKGFVVLTFPKENVVVGDELAKIMAE